MAAGNRRRVYRERAQPEARKKYGLLEKHKDYVLRAQAYHQKQQTLRKLKEKAAFRNPDEFYFGMVKSKTVNGVHRPQSRANKCTRKELILKKTQERSYILQKLQSEKKEIERLTSVLHFLGEQKSNKHIYYAEDRKEAEEIQARMLEQRNLQALEDIPSDIRRRSTPSSYRELKARRSKVQELEKMYTDMTMQSEQKKGQKRKLCEDEIWRVGRKGRACTVY